MVKISILSHLNKYRYLRTVNRLLVASLVFATAGCANVPYPVTSPYYQIPPGSQVVLNQALTIPANSGRVYLQYGKVISANDKDRYQPNCWFLSWKVLEQPQVIQPDVFKVTGTQKSDDVVQNSPTIQLASAALFAGSSLEVASKSKMSPMDGDAPLASEYTTQIKIHSDRQPDIRLLECSHWDDPSSGEHLTLEKIQSALGKIATINIVADDLVL